MRAMSALLVLGLVLHVVSLCAAADKPQDRWKEKTEVDKITDEKMVYMFRVADGEYFKLGNIVEGNWPRLAVGCQGKRRFFGIQLATAPKVDDSGGVEVTTRHGTFNPVTLTWRVSAGSAKGIVVADRMAINFAAVLTLVDRFLVRYKSKESSDVTLEFTTFGVKDHLPMIARACGWDYQKALREAH